MQKRRMRDAKGERMKQCDKLFRERLDRERDLVFHLVSQGRKSHPKDQRCISSGSNGKEQRKSHLFSNSRLCMPFLVIL
jgi:hypothetical protein